MHSWRVQVLLFLIQDYFYARYDQKQPWNGPINVLLTDEIPDTWTDRHGKTFQALYECPDFYRCPSAPQSQNRMCTNYVMLIDDRPGKPNGPPHRPGSVPPSPDRSQR